MNQRIAAYKKGSVLITLDRIGNLYVLTDSRSGTVCFGKLAAALQLFSKKKEDLTITDIKN